MGSLFFLGGGAFGHFFLFPITFRFLASSAGTDMQFMPKVGRVLLVLLVVPARAWGWCSSSRW